MLPKAYSQTDGDLAVPLTQGSVLFADASGFIAQDNANFFWNDTLNRLGVGTSSPAAVAHFKGLEAALSSAYSVSVYEDATPIASRTGTGGKAEFRGIYTTAGDVTVAGQFGASKVNQTSGQYGFDMVFSPRRNGSSGFEERLRLTSVGKLGVGISNPDSRLMVVEETIGDDVFNIASLTSVPDYVRSMYRQNRVATTDATLTTLLSLALSASRTYWLRAVVVARRTGGTAGTAEDGAVYILSAAYKMVAGVPTLIGAATMDFQAEDQVGLDVSFVASGGSVLVRVTGAANNNITWHGTLNYGYVST